MFILFSCKMFILKIIIVSTFFCSIAYCKEYDIQIVSDSPIAAGTSVTFNLTLLLDGKPAPKDRYQFRYSFLGNEEEKQTTDSWATFIVECENLDHGHYNIDFAVDYYFFFTYLERAKKRSDFEVTNHFTGLMQLTQGPNNTVRKSDFVSSQYETVHNIIVGEKDKRLYEKAAYVRVYWFIDCLHVGMTNSLDFKRWYTNENGKYNVEALLMLSFEPLPVPTSTTTLKPTTSTTTTTTTTTPKTTTSTSTTTTTTTTPSTTTSTTTTSSTPTTTTTTKKPDRKRRDATGQNFEWNLKSLIESGSIRPENVAYENMTEPSIIETTELSMEEKIKLLDDSLIPYFGVCMNSSRVVLDPKKIYGYYQRTLIVQNPVSNISVGNNVWLRHGDMCQLSIKFTGTSPFSYCTSISRSDNSSISTEECDDWKEIDVKEIDYKHFFYKTSNSYILNIYIKNEVSLTRTPIGVKFYEDQPHSQLSVIIVPIVFSLMAVVVIVFGVAYYVQNRNQFLIEVADFNFGETQSVDSLEYKSFVQRLLDNISDLFIAQNFNEEPDSGEPSNRYNVMP